MAISTEITRLQGAKASLKTSIENKGVNVPSATKIDGYAALVDQISQGATEATENDVNFYDYDGFRVASYTIAEAKALTALPTPPAHEGLTFQEWNWTLADITSYDRQYIDVGANYITTDGKTHIFVNVEAGEPVSFNLSIPNYHIANIDWGDDSQIETYSGESSITHNYLTAGIKEIKIDVLKDGGTPTNGAYFNVTPPLRAFKILLGAGFCLQQASYAGIISVPKDSCSYPTSASRSYFLGKCVSIPKVASFNTNCLYQGIGKVCFPKSINSEFPTRMANAFQTTRMVIPNSADANAKLKTDTVQSETNTRVVSIPNVPLATDNVTYFNGLSKLSYIDIVQGWIPNNSIRLDYSTLWTDYTMVKFFNKLGTTSTAITLTFGSTNLNKLTADQKAIATNKGYTLA